MKTLQFKTNIKCSGCIAKASPALNEEEGVEKWEVNIYTPDKILTVETDLTEEQIIETVNKAGFNAEPLKKEKI